MTMDVAWVLVLKCHDLGLQVLNWHALPDTCSA